MSIRSYLSDGARDFGCGTAHLQRAFREWGHLLDSVVPGVCKCRAETMLSVARRVIALPEKWWAERDSNPRHPACKAGALTN